MADVKLIEKTKDGSISFVVKDISPACANALRRAAISEVPVMAVDEIEFRKNSSPLYDEMIAHRIGLIPLTTDIKSYNLPAKCKCEGKGCASCQVKLTLKAKGPATVYSGEFESNDKAIKPVFPKIPIVKLLKNQSLELEATAVLGRGREHVKWAPGIVYYNQLPKIEIKDAKEHCAKCERMVEECPVEFFEYKNNKLSFIKDNYYRVNVDEAVVNACPEHVSVTLSGDFRFCVESFGQLDSDELMVEAVKAIEEQIDEFADAFKKSKE